MLLQGILRDIVLRLEKATSYVSLVWHAQRESSIETVEGWKPGGREGWREVGGNLRI